MNYKKTFRQILREEKTVLVPGCYDALSGKLLKQAGFRIIYMTGSGVTSSLLGKPDVGLLSMAEMIGQARYIINATGLPLICDADTGYGSSINVIRTVEEYENCGAAAIHLEDQLMPKKCGHFEGKAVIDAEEMAKKIKAALHARQDPDFMIIARSDARAVLGFDEVLRRGKLYRDAGADMLFIEAPQSEKELEIIARTFEDTPLLVNIVEGGKTAMLPFDYLKDLGFKVVLYPTAGVRVAMKALRDYSAHLFANNDTSGMLDKMVTFEERNTILGLNAIKETEARFGGAAPAARS